MLKLNNKFLSIVTDLLNNPKKYQQQGGKEAHIEQLENQYNITLNTMSFELTYRENKIEIFKPLLFSILKAEIVEEEFKGLSLGSLVKKMIELKN